MKFNGELFNEDKVEKTVFDIVEYGNRELLNYVSKYLKGEIPAFPPPIGLSGGDDDHDDDGTLMNTMKIMINDELIS